MAGKGSRKALKAQKGELFLERFVYDILDFTLPLCGLPKEKLKSKERNKNAYADGNIISASVTVLTIALKRRDGWKSMFESRLKSSGLDTIEKIKAYLKTFFIILPDFRDGITIYKMRISLAAYIEMILFLNYKDIEFDFEQLIILWRIHFLELISQITSQREASELILRYFAMDHSNAMYTTWFYAFLKYFAVPYGHRTDVSEVFLQRVDELTQNRVKKNEELANMVAHFTPSEMDAVLPPDFESQAVLPGDRESPEPPGLEQRGVLPDDRESPEPPGFEWQAVSPGDRESPVSSECSPENAVSGKDTTQYAMPRVPLGYEPLSVLKDEGESPEQPAGCSPISRIRRKEKRPRRRSVLSTDDRLNPSKEQGIEDKFGQMRL